MDKRCGNCKFWTGKKHEFGHCSKKVMWSRDIDGRLINPEPALCGYLYSCDKHSGLDNNELKEEE